MQSINCSLKTKQAKGGHKSRVETRRAVSKRKCSANHKLSTNRSLRSPTSWATRLSPRWTNNTSIQQGRKGYSTGKPASWGTLSLLCRFPYPVFLENLTVQEAPMAFLTPDIISLSFHLSDNKKLVFHFWLKGGNQLDVFSEDLKNLIFCFLGFSSCFFPICWFSFVRSLGSVMKKHLLKPKFSVRQC